MTLMRRIRPIRLIGLLGLTIAALGCVPRPPAPGGGGGAVPFEAPAGDLAATREAREQNVRVRNDFDRAIDRQDDDIAAMEIARVQAWLNWLSLLSALVGIGFAVASIWLPVLRKFAVYVAGAAVTAALLLRGLAWVWPWWKILAIAVGALVLARFGWLVWRIYQQRKDAEEAFSLSSAAADALGNMLPDGVKEQEFLTRLASAERLTRAKLKALRDKLVPKPGG